jgi:hypothetical protein
MNYLLCHNFLSLLLIKLAGDTPTGIGRSNYLLPSNDYLPLFLLLVAMLPPAELAAAPAR